MKINIGFIFLILLIIYTDGFSQKGKTCFHFYSTLSIPREDFKYYAKNGFGGGFEVNYAVFDKIRWTSSITLLSNKEDLSSLQFDEEGEESSWINMPILTGLTYQTHFGSDVKFYSGVKAGVNLVKKTDRISGQYKDSFKLSQSFCYGFSIGIVLFKKVNIGARYLELGEPAISVISKSLSTNESYTSDFTQKISMHLLTVGVVF